MLIKAKKSKIRDEESIVYLPIGNQHNFPNGAMCNHLEDFCKDCCRCFPGMNNITVHGPVETYLANGRLECKTQI